MGLFDCFKPKLTAEDLEDIQVIEEQCARPDHDTNVTSDVYSNLLERGVWQEQLPSGEWVWHKQNGPV